MDQKAKEFLKTHKIAVLAVLQENGVVHAAALNFAHNEEPLTFYFCTGKSTEKCRSLLNGEKRNASVVIGFSEEEYATIQAEGTVEIVDDDSAGWDVYTKKYPNRSSSKENPHVATLKFTPTWLRYRDYKQDPPYETVVIEDDHQSLTEWQRLEKV